MEVVAQAARLAAFIGPEQAAASGALLELVGRGDLEGAAELHAGQCRAAGVRLAKEGRYLSSTLLLRTATLVLHFVRDPRDLLLHRLGQAGVLRSQTGSRGVGSVGGGGGSGVGTRSQPPPAASSQALRPVSAGAPVSPGVGGHHNAAKSARGAPPPMVASKALAAGGGVGLPQAAAQAAPLQTRSSPSSGVKQGEKQSAMHGVTQGGGGAIVGKGTPAGAVAVGTLGATARGQGGVKGTIPGGSLGTTAAPPKAAVLKTALPKAAPVAAPKAGGAAALVPRPGAPHAFLGAAAAAKAKEAKWSAGAMAMLQPATVAASAAASAANTAASTVAGSAAGAYAGSPGAQGLDPFNPAFTGTIGSGAGVGGGEEDDRGFADATASMNNGNGPGPDSAVTAAAAEAAAAEAAAAEAMGRHGRRRLLAEAPAGLASGPSVGGGPGVGPGVGNGGGLAAAVARHARSVCGAQRLTLQGLSAVFREGRNRPFWLDRKCATHVCTGHSCTLCARHVHAMHTRKSLGATCSRHPAAFLF